MLFAIVNPDRRVVAIYDVATLDRAGAAYGIIDGWTVQPATLEAAIGMIHKNGAFFLPEPDALDATHGRA